MIFGLVLFTAEQDSRRIFLDPSEIFVPLAIFVESILSYTVLASIASRL